MQAVGWVFSQQIPSYMMKMIFRITLQAIMHNVDNYLMGGIPIFQMVELRVTHSIL